jgi:hypothetical protein
VSKYAEATRELLKPFASSAWTATGVQAIPAALYKEAPAPEFVVLSPVFSGRSQENIKSINGLLMCMISTQRNSGPERLMEIADALDNLLSNKIFGRVQVFSSSASTPQPDGETRSMLTVSLPFSFFWSF